MISIAHLLSFPIEAEVTYHLSDGREYRAQVTMDSPECVVWSSFTSGRVFREPTFLQSEMGLSLFRGESISVITVNLGDVHWLTPDVRREPHYVVDMPLESVPGGVHYSRLKLKLEGIPNIEIDAYYPEPTAMEERMFIRSFLDSGRFFALSKSGFLVANLTKMVSAEIVPPPSSLPAFVLRAAT